MSQPELELLTQPPQTDTLLGISELLQRTDPLLAESVDALGMPEQAFDRFSVPAIELPSHGGLKRILGVAVGAVVLAGGGSQVATADEICGGNLYFAGYYIDGSPACSVVPIPPPTTPTPTSPPVETLPPTPTSPPSGGGSNSGGSNTTVRPTTIDLDIDNDTFERDRGFLPDVDDNSPGLGEQGALEARALGIDVDSGSEEANRNLLIAYTVNPDDWDQTIANFAFYGIAVMTPTTTTSTTVAPTTTEAGSVPATTETEEMTGTTEVEVATTEVQEQAAPTTEQNATPVVVDTDSSDGSGNNRLLLLGLGVIGALGGLGGLVVAARRRSEDEPQTPQAFGESPVA